MQEEKPVIVEQVEQDNGNKLNQIALENQKLNQIALENQNLTTMLRKLENDIRDLQRVLADRDNALLSSKQLVQQANKQI